MCYGHYPIIDRPRCPSCGACPTCGQRDTWGNDWVSPHETPNEHEERIKKAKEYMDLWLQTQSVKNDTPNQPK